MEKITSVVELRAAIQLLEMKHAQETELLREQFKMTYESIRPANLVKGALRDLVVAPDLKEGVFSSLLGTSLGTVTKKILVGATLNPVKLLFGTVLQMLVTTLVSKNADGIKTATTQFMKKIVRKKNVVV